MGLYTQIPTNTATTLQMGAGILATTFTPATGAVSGIIGATTGGITITATPSYSDLGEDIDNAPKNTKDFKHLDSWECKIAGTYLTLTASGALSMVGAADLASGDNTHVVPRATIAAGDFHDIWFIGDYGAAGYLAVKLSNALNITGFSVKTSDAAKGQVSFEYLGHGTVAAPTVVPMDIYVKDQTTFTVTYTLTKTTKLFGPVEIATGDDLVARFAAGATYALPATITVTEGGSTKAVGVDYTWDQTNGIIVFAAVAGNIVVTVTSA